MALHGDKPVLVIAPKPLVLQWQGELKDLITSGLEIIDFLLAMKY